MTDLPVGLISMAVTCSDVRFRQNADITRLAGIQVSAIVHDRAHRRMSIPRKYCARCMHKIVNRGTADARNEGAPRA
jgi:hypothetical protein